MLADVCDDQHGEHRHQDDRARDDEDDDGGFQRFGPRGPDDGDQHDDEHENRQQPTKRHDGERFRRPSMISLNAVNGWAPRTKRTTRMR